MEALIIPAASLISVALLLGWLAHTSEADTLDRNALVGIRTRATMASDAAWYAGHRAAAASVRLAAWTSGVAGVAGTVLAIVGTWVAVVSIAIGYASMVALLAVATVRAGRAARATEDGPLSS